MEAGISPYSAVAIGGSAGSLEALLKIFSLLPEKFNPPIIIVIHLHPSDDGGLVDLFIQQTKRNVKEARDKEQIQPESIYFAPTNYHLLVERERTFALSVDAKVNYSRPSIDVFFESAAIVWGEGLIGILLTGANNDGASGIEAIKEHGGLTIVQDPAQAAHPIMPQAAINTGSVDKILSLEEIGGFLQSISKDNDENFKKG
ncbi:MAG: chemotaxis protein CheB [Pseudomonadota bacterium]